MDGIVNSLQGQMSGQHQANVGSMLGQRWVNVRSTSLQDLWVTSIFVCVTDVDRKRSVIVGTTYA